MDAVVESGRNPVSKHQTQPELDNDQADAGQDGRTKPVSRETKFSGANEDREMFISPCSADHHEQDWQPYPIDPYSARSVAHSAWRYSWPIYKTYSR